MSTALLDELKADVHSIKALLTEAMFGNPAIGQPGVYIRIDRLEQINRILIWVCGASFTAASGAIAAHFIK